MTMIPVTIIERLSDALTLSDVWLSFDSVLQRTQNRKRMVRLCRRASKYCNHVSTCRPNSDSAPVRPCIARHKTCIKNVSEPRSRFVTTRNVSGVRTSSVTGRMGMPCTHHLSHPPPVAVPSFAIPTINCYTTIVINN
jgi:hypothetical protein